MTPIHEPAARPTLLRRGRRLSWLTVGWNVVEGAIAVAAAVAAGSIALLGFGLDSFVESLSGVVILWRLAAERRTADAERIERVEVLARRGVASSMWLLAAFVAFESVTTLLDREEPSTSVIGILLLVVSIAVMRWLGNAKRRVAIGLHSHAMEADAKQTDICWQLSVVTLAGLAANAVLGWWWADPVAALALAGLIAHEGRLAWQRKACCAV